MRYGNATLLSVAPLTCAFIAINVVLYCICAMRSGNLGDMSSEALIAMGGSLRERLWEGDWLRLIAPNFLHGGFLHILLNTMFLFQLGPVAETYFGSANFGTIYLLSGVAGFCMSQICGGNLSVGASCSLFGIMGSILAVKVLQQPVWRNAWRNPEVRHVAFVIGINLAIGLTGMLNIDNWGHLGGLLIGTLLAFALELWRRRHKQGVIAVAVVVLAVAGMVAAARWTVFSPFYHLHQGAVAAEEKRSQQEIDAHFDQARAWSDRWCNGQLVEIMIQTHQAGHWHAQLARNVGYRQLAERHRQVLKAISSPQTGNP